VDASARNPTLAVIEGARPEVSVLDRLAGLPVGERVLRAAIRAGYTRVLVWTPSQSRDWIALAGRFTTALDITVTNDASLWDRHLANLDPQTPVTVLAPASSPPRNCWPRQTISFPRQNHHRLSEVPRWSQVAAQRSVSRSPRAAS